MNTHAALTNLLKLSWRLHRTHTKLWFPFSKEKSFIWLFQSVRYLNSTSQKWKKNWISLLLNSLWLNLFEYKSWQCTGFRSNHILKLDGTATRDASGPGVCFGKLRNGHSPLIPLCSFLVTVCNSTYSWHFTISQWDFSHCLDPCRCLQWLKSAFEAHGIYQSWLHILQGLASHLAYSTEDKSHHSQTGDLAHQGW